MRDISLPKVLELPLRKSWHDVKGSSELKSRLSALINTTARATDKRRRGKYVWDRTWNLMFCVAFSLGAYTTQDRGSHALSFLLFLGCAIAAGICGIISALVPWKDYWRVLWARKQLVASVAGEFAELTSGAITAIGAHVGGYTDNDWDIIFNQALASIDIRNQTRVRQVIITLLEEPGMYDVTGEAIISTAIGAIQRTATIAR